MFELIDVFQSRFFNLWFLNVIEIKQWKWSFKNHFSSKFLCRNVIKNFMWCFFSWAFNWLKSYFLSLSLRICKSKFLHQNFHNECANQRFFLYVISYNYIRLIKITFEYKFERSCWCFENYIIWTFLQTFRFSNFIAFALHIKIFHSFICILCI